LANALEIVLEASRFLLAVVFLTAGLSKFLDPQGTRTALRDFGIPNAVAPAFVMMLLAAEIGVALLFFTTTLVWYAAWGAAGLLTIFVLAVLIAMIRGRHPDCHCFGQIHSEPAGWPIVLRNLVFGASAAALINAGPAWHAVNLIDWFNGLGPSASKFAAVGAGAVCLGIFVMARRVKPRVAEVENAEIDEERWEWGDQPASPPAPRPKPAPPTPVSQADPEPVESTSTGNGLPIGTPAPYFDLPTLMGKRRTLASLRASGKDLLLVFVSPHCKPCMAVVPGVARWVKEQPAPPNYAIISRGTPEENETKLADFDPARVFLQKGMEVAQAYDSMLTPTALWIDASGRIRTEVATGGPAIRKLLYPNGQSQAG